MDKVLKRVGLAKWDSDLKEAQNVSPERDSTIIIAKRRRCENRRFLHDKKIRGLFNIDWDSVKDCKSCKSRVMTRKLCGRRSDNELYRSNSFKFERFVKCSDDTSSIGQTVSLCDDYSLPVDYVKKKRPNSVVVNTTEWNIVSPSDEQIKVVVDSQPNLNEQNLLINTEVEKDSFTDPDKKYFFSEYSSGSSSNEEFIITRERTNSRKSACEISNVKTASCHRASINRISVLSPTRTDTANRPSPYYYADLFKKKEPDVAPLPQEQVDQVQDFRSSDKEDDIVKNHKNSTEKSKKHHRRHKHRSDTGSSHKSNFIEQAGAGNDPVNESSSPCDLTNIFTQIALNDDDMTRKRHQYETAFDSVTKQEEDVDPIDSVCNHPVLMQLTNSRPQTVATQSASSPTNCDTKSCEIILSREDVPSQSKSTSDILSQSLRDMHLDSKEESFKGNLLLRAYTPSPPSSTPVSTSKLYNSKSNATSSDGSISNVEIAQHRTKDFRLPIKSLNIRRNCNSPSVLVTSAPTVPTTEVKSTTDTSGPTQHRNVLEIKDRTRKVFKHRHKDGSKDLFRYSKGIHRRRKYSSTESMTTSSSGGSMESLQSSTSEGNRSTSSSESRHSTSLSSHSSDSGNTNYHYPQAYNFLIHSNKLNILSPISDKSSQEPVSELSDNNRNNNSQKCSPEEISPTHKHMNTNTKPKKRLPFNKNVINLGLHIKDPEIQGSDSGISIQSRESKTFLGFMSQNQDLAELPFDIPQSACSRAMQNDACTSGSSTSIDFRDLPFDMPKLKRRLRPPQSLFEPAISQASSSQSVIDIDKQLTPLRPNLSLNLKDPGSRQKPSLSLSFGRLGLNLNIKNSSALNASIDANLPLERQGWYHGAITRIEAEFVLKFLKEGSFLVRNSESTRQDYSLSLKSARGFMHMRIQKNGPDSFILGQFSKPFRSIPEMIYHFSLNRLPVRGAEHMCLLQPVIAQLL